MFMEFANQTESQKCQLELTSVWKAKCKEFHRKIRNSGVHGVGEPNGIAEMSARIDFSMENKM